MVHSALFLLLLGLFVGVVSTLTGVGGGGVMVPALYEVLPGLPPQSAIACSLGVIFLNSLVNTYNFAKIDRLPDWRLALPMGVCLAAGVLIGGKLANSLDAKTLKTIFGLILSAVILRGLLFSPPPHQSAHWNARLNPARKAALLCCALLGGVVSGITGLGGGSILLPAMLLIARTPLNWIPPYTNAAMILGTLAGIAYYASEPAPAFFADTPWQAAQVGQVNVAIALAIFVGAALSSRFGARFGQRKAGACVAKWALIVLQAFFVVRLFLTP